VDSGLPQAAYALIGIKLPRTAAAQRDWLAAGHGTRIPPGQEQPGDLIFWDSYLGPSTIGHVVIVLDPQAQTTIEAHDRKDGVGSFSYTGKQTNHSIFEIWRPA
jgi:cell wall-associated NlpC family hydrolase